LRGNNVRHGKVRCGVVPAILVVALVLMSTACAAVPSNQTPSPEASASAPAASPSAEASPSTAPVSSPAPLKITSLYFHAGEVAVPYATVNMVAAGGVTPYGWSITSGFLPSGLSVFGSTVHGTPTSVGTWLFTVRVVDAAGQTASANRSITVARHLTATASCPTSQPCRVEAGCVTVCGKFGIVGGGVGPLRYTLTAGAIPTGMGRSGLSLTGTFPAPATRTGTKTWLFTITVTDALGVVVPVAANFYVFAHIAFTVSSFTCDGAINTGCTATTTYTGGTPGLAIPTIKATLLSTTPAGMTLPPGYSFTARSGTVTVSFPNIGCGVNQFLHIWVVSLVLVDQSICAAGKYCSSAPSKLTATLINPC
jgi:large repetitive protein